MSLSRIVLFACLVSLLAGPGIGQAQMPAGADALPKGALLRMGSSRMAHANWLTCVQFSPDDRWVGAADADGVIRIWETATGKLALEKPKDTGRELAFSPDGKTLAIAGYYSREMVLWDLKQGEVIRELPQNARSLEFSSDGALLAAAGEDKIVRLWDPHTGKLQRELRGHQAELFAVAISPDGRWVASGGGGPGDSDNNEILLWEAATGKELARLDDDNERMERLPDAVYALDFSADGKTLGAAGPYVVRLWDVDRKKLRHRLTDCSYDVAFSPVAGYLAAPGDFGIYDLASGQQQTRLGGDVSVYGCVDYSHDGKLIVSGNKEGYVQLWNTASGKEIVLRSGHQGGIRDVAFSPDGTVAASVSRQDATIRLWGTASGTQLVKIPVVWRGPDVWWSEEGSGVQFAPFGREVLTWTYDGTVRYWKPDSLDSRTVQVGESSATAMAFSADGTRAVAAQYAGDSRNSIVVHELDGGSLVATIKPSENESSSDAWVSALCFSPDGKTLAVGLLSGSLRDSPAPSVQLWDLKRQTLTRRLRPALAPPGKICFSPDGALLATSAVRGSPLQLWRLSDGTEVRSFQVEADAHGRDPAPIAFSPDGKRLAAADANRQIYVWELATGEKIRTFAGHQKAVTSIAFSPDGNTLLSGSEDATLLLWDVGGGDNLSGIKLTPEQLSDYWDALASSDAEIAAGAAKQLHGAADQAVQIFAARLTPGEVHDAAELPALVAQLRGEDAKAQLNAASQLKAFGIKASPALFKALADKPPLAVRSRIEEVLQAIGEFPIAPQTLQRTRAIQLLEQIGSEGAVGILKNLAAAKPPTAASLDAKAALERLEQRLRAPKIGLAPEG